MSKFTKTEASIIRETNKMIVEELAEAVLSGERITKREVMKEYGISNTRAGVTRATNLLNMSVKNYLAEKGYYFCCIDHSNYEWGIVKSETDFQAVVSNRIFDLKSRAKSIIKIQNQAVQLGYTVEQLPLLTVGEEEKLNESNTDRN